MRPQNPAPPPNWAILARLEPEPTWLTSSCDEFLPIENAAFERQEMLSRVEAVLGVLELGT